MPVKLVKAFKISFPEWDSGYPCFVYALSRSKATWVAVSSFRAYICNKKGKWPKLTIQRMSSYDRLFYGSGLTLNTPYVPDYVDRAVERAHPGCFD